MGKGGAAAGGQAAKATAGGGGGGGAEHLQAEITVCHALPAQPPIAQHTTIGC